MEQSYSWLEIANMPQCCMCCGSRNVDLQKDVCLNCGSDEGLMADERTIENNCQCGISDKTGKWSEKLFEEFGCNCREEISGEET